MSGGAAQRADTRAAWCSTNPYSQLLPSAQTVSPTRARSPSYATARAGSLTVPTTLAQVESHGAVGAAIKNATPTHRQSHSTSASSRDTTGVVAADSMSSQRTSGRASGRASNHTLIPHPTMSAAKAPFPDILFRSPLIISGDEGEEPYVADVLVSGGRIVQIGPAISSSASPRIVQAAGLVLCPGAL